MAVFKYNEKVAVVKKSFDDLLTQFLVVGYAWVSNSVTPKEKHSVI